MQPEILSETPITMAELKAGLEAVKKRDKVPSFRVIRTEEYLSSFETLRPDEAGKLFDKLMKLNIPRLREVHICKLIDLLPADANDVKLILQGYTITVSNDNIKKIVDTVREFVK
ncbi:hypothetical protein HYV82_05390 [Candidatus Woesearchaeota archaeon]|nr:hypothetical protein [Candidatus Woesearchaeota archaeon]